jgi:hypothetical protein
MVAGGLEQAAGLLAADRLQVDGKVGDERDDSQSRESRIWPGRDAVFTGHWSMQAVPARARGSIWSVTGRPVCLDYIHGCLIEALGKPPEKYSVREGTKQTIGHLQTCNPLGDSEMPCLFGLLRHKLLADSEACESCKSSWPRHPSAQLFSWWLENLGISRYPTADQSPLVFLHTID